MKGNMDYQVDFQNKEIKQQLQKLQRIALHVKIATFIMVIVFDHMFEDFDQCAELLLDENLQLSPLQNILYSSLKGYNRWDGIFFLGIAQEGYTKEKNHAFFPGIPMIISFLGGIINPVIGNRTISHMVGSYLMNFFLYFMIVKLVYKITYKVFKKQRMAYICALLFIVNPSSIFYSAVYTESAYFFLLLSGINKYIDTFYLIRMGACDSFYEQFLNIYMPSLYFLISLLMRSTGLFSLTVPAQLTLMQVYRVVKINKKKNINMIWEIIKVCILGLMILVQCVIVYYLIVGAYPYYLYCTESSTDIPTWCSNTIPNLYSFIQEQYWGVSLLNSYNPARTTDMHWALQTVYITFFGIVDWIKRIKYDEQTMIQFPFFVTNCVLWAISTFYAHIFSFTRFFTTNIMFYWTLYFMIDKDGEARRHHIIRYLVLFNCAGTLFFSNFIVWI